MYSYKSFLLQLIGLSLFVEIISLGWFFGMPQAWVTHVLPFLPVFFMSVTFIIHKAFMGVLGKNPRQFVTSYMLITTIKLLSFLAILFVYAVLKPKDAMAFLLSFFVLYIVYSAFEAVAVIKLNKNRE
jgi:hypothetical protein